MFEQYKRLHFLVIHGPNLNLLGEREPEIYGTLTLTKLNDQIRQFCRTFQIRLRFFQSNHEGEIIDIIHENRRWADGIVINPGALTHYSYALRDCIASVEIPTVEVHLSDIHKRESFRKKSVIKEVCIDQVSGHGKNSYFQGIKRLVEEIRNK